MPKSNKKACRGGGRQRDTVAGVRRSDSSTAAPEVTAESAQHISCARVLEVALWSVFLHQTEVGVLLALMTLQPADGAAFGISYAALAQRVGLSSALCVHAVNVLRERRLLEVVERGNATRANRYRVPGLFPPAGEIVVRMTKAEGGAA
jgi:hypothetical protein